MFRHRQTAFVRINSSLDCRINGLAFALHFFPEIAQAEKCTFVGLDRKLARMREMHLLRCKNRASHAVQVTAEAITGLGIKFVAVAVGRCSSAAVMIADFGTRSSHPFFQAFQRYTAMRLEIRSSGGRSANLRRCAAILMCCILTASAASSAEAQQRSTQRRFEPARPTVSPWLGLLQSNSGAIPNYFSLVRPRLEQQQFNAQVRANEQFRSLQIQQLNSSAAGGETVPQTGKPAGFMQFLHYFPEPSTGRGR